MKPILFNTEMVQAILEGRKTVTRRLVKPKYRKDEGGFRVCTNKATGEKWVEKYDWDEGSFDNPRYVKPPYRAGDILYVRETWSEWTDGYAYKVQDPQAGYNYPASYIGKWKPSLHMPKEAARIFLRVKEVRIERLQEMVNFRAEGIKTSEQCDICHAVNGQCHPDTASCDNEVDTFADLWNSTIKKSDLDRYGWNANPWVWAIEFDRISKEEALQD